MMNLEIKKMTSAHIGEIAELEKECFSSPWSEDGLKSELDNKFSRFFVAFSDGKCGI